MVNRVVTFSFYRSILYSSRDVGRTVVVATLHRLIIVIMFCCSCRDIRSDDIS